MTPTRFKLVLAFSIASAVFVPLNIGAFVVGAYIHDPGVATFNAVVAIWNGFLAYRGFRLISSANQAGGNRS